MVAERFQIHRVKIIRILSQVLIITTPDRRKLPISLTPYLYFFSAGREEDYGAEKIINIKLEKGINHKF